MKNDQKESEALKVNHKNKRRLLLNHCGSNKALSYKQLLNTGFVQPTMPLIRGGTMNQNSLQCDDPSHKQ
jgi:hypothetical protein